MVRVASGVITQVFHFERQTALSAFAIFRKRGAGAWTAMTTPTVTENDSVNAPGIYSVLMDEDMVITALTATEEMCFYITAGGMQPHLEKIEIFKARPDVNIEEVNNKQLIGDGGATPFNVA